MHISEEHIVQLKKYFAQQPVLKAYIFGSYAKETENESSDIDILVDLDYKNGIGLEFVQMQIDLQQMFSKNIDLVSSNGVSKYIKPIIDQEKIIIYER